MVLDKISKDLAEFCYRNKLSRYQCPTNGNQLSYFTQNSQNKMENAFQLTNYQNPIQFSSCNINSDECQQISTAISQCPKLKTLELNLNFNKICNLSLSLLIQFFRSRIYLKFLNLILIKNQISDSGIAYLFLQLKDIKNLKKLFLKLNGNEITNNCAQVISKGLNGCKNLQQFTMNLQCTKFCLKGLKEFSDRLNNGLIINYLKIVLDQQEKPKNFKSDLMKKLRNLVKLDIDI
ncbi:hypothetical protein ABPG72_002132 [Tetrahymena utriculariae]